MEELSNWIWIAIAAFWIFGGALPKLFKRIRGSASESDIHSAKPRRRSSPRRPSDPTAGWHLPGSGTGPKPIEPK